jgi:hypothetical protein
MRFFATDHGAKIREATAGDIRVILVREQESSFDDS